MKEQVVTFEFDILFVAHTDQHLARTMIYFSTSYSNVREGITALCAFNGKPRSKLVLHHGWIHPRPSSKLNIKVAALMRSGVFPLTPEKPFRVKVN